VSRDALGQWYRRREALVLGAAGLVGAGLGWEAAARLGAIDAVVLASPSRVGVALARQWRSGELVADLATSVAEFGLAFALALVVGGTLGLLMALVRDAEYALDPFVWFLYSAPLVAFQPLLVVWLGFGFWTVVALSTALAALPIAVNTHAGVRAVDPALLRVVRAYGGRRRDEVVKVLLPAALPLVLAGLRIAAGRVLVGIVVGEMFSANAGLGFRLSFYGARLRAADVLVPLLGVVAIGVLATQAVRLVEQRFGAPAPAA
jgi:NitT/TauT family transport system permease protein